ncbi:MAG: hypothetical protein HW414_625, partial [Dehalococcoidia bacterium]|nr:hypothetical protein [Dehalococcoidia bacterium]
KVVERMVKFDWNSVQSLLVVGDNAVWVTVRLPGWPNLPDFTGSDTVKVK